MTAEKTILIVDDSEFDRNLLLRALSKKGGFKVIEADTSDKCLELITTQPVDLILMDIMMPGTFGTQTLKTIRDKFNAIQLPIIMITAKTDTADVVESLRLGANDYLTKPVNFELAISRILTHLNLADTSREMGKLQEIAALHAMISTYNHEINNPLTIALGKLKKVAANRDDTESLQKTEAALWRIAEIVKKIRQISEQHEVQYQPYAGTGKMVKIK